MTPISTTSHNFFIFFPIFLSAPPISYVQYMPAKPIKHGIKVFALCCAVSAVILAFKVYAEKEADSNGSAAAVCDELCVDTGLLHQRGRVLYTDNYYTSVKLAKLMFEKYGWTIVGTMTTRPVSAHTDATFVSCVGCWTGLSIHALLLLFTVLVWWSSTQIGNVTRVKITVVMTSKSTWALSS